MKHLQFEAFGLHCSPEAAVVTVYAEGEVLVVLYKETDQNNPS